MYSKPQQGPCERRVTTQSITTKVDLGRRAGTHLRSLARQFVHRPYPPPHVSLPPSPPLLAAFLVLSRSCFLPTSSMSRCQSALAAIYAPESRETEMLWKT